MIEFIASEFSSDDKPVKNAPYSAEAMAAKRVQAGVFSNGVQADGAHIVTVIPAGQIGNERDIEIVSERWYSPELQTVVMSRRNDPRSGETVYRLTNLRLGEPPRELFEPPAYYTVQEGGGRIRIMRRDEKTKE